MQQPRVFPYVSILLASLAAVLVLGMARPVPAMAASAKAEFTKGYYAFHELTKDPRKAKYRDQWRKVEDHFRAALKADPDGSYAPKSLYSLGRVNEELGRRSGLTSDFRTADDYYGRMIKRFPRHGWTDDCLFRRAKIRIERLNMITYGTRDLQTIVADYPKSDMYAEAKILLQDMGKSVPKSDTTQTATSAPRAAGNGMQKASKAEPVHRDPPNMAHLQEVRYTSSSDYTRVVLDLDEEVPYRYQLLGPRPDVGRPHRLYIDLEKTRIGNDIHRNVTVADGILKGIRSAQNDTETTRVVFDFLDLQDYKVFHLNNPYRVVVDVYAPEGSRGVAEEPVTQSLKKGQEKKTGKTPVAVTGSKNMAGDLVEQLGLTIKTIMIDPGHGGHDPGAYKDGVKEKDINLAMAKTLGAMLEDKGFKVLYTRTTDKFIPLEERTAMANIKKADMFISLHVNAHRNTRINGIETYTLNLAKTKDAKRVAARENAVDPKQISDLQYILTDLMLGSKLKESTDLAASVQARMVTSLRKNWKVNDHGVREAPFYVLMGAKMPAVLIETGYMSNATERGRLKSDYYRKFLAQGIVEGVLDYKHQIESFAGG